jgi:hypothetical protein
MTACAACGKQFGNDFAFCDQCGSLPPNKGLLKASVLGIGAMIQHDAFQTVSSPVTPPKPVVAQDDVSRAIAKCGKPDLDKAATATKNGKTTTTRILTYKRARVTLRYRPSTEKNRQTWIFDTARNVSGQKITSEQLSKNLPCLK